LRKLSLSDAVFIGLAAMLGAGLFVVFAPAAALAGSWLWLAILLAAAVAYLNAASIAQLARVVTRSGGAYSYGRQYLGKAWGFAAGAAFLIGKVGSAAAIALTIGNYLWPAVALPIALGAIAAMATINILGVNRTALGSKILASITLAFLILLVALAWLQPAVNAPVSDSVTDAAASPAGAELIELLSVPAAAALVFFAFAGYARVATLGGEVIDPQRSVPRAIAVSLAIVLIVYLLLAITLQRGLGAALATSVRPLADLAERVGFATAAVIGVAAAAGLGSLLALLAGMSRTAATMAEDGELPRVFSKTARSGAPWLAELTVALAAAILTFWQDPVWVIGLSSFAVLTYYAIANFAALRQPKLETSRPKFLNWLGLAVCLLLAASVPVSSLGLGLALMLLALTTRWALARIRRID
jgi:basic amino acid/polyamine antiporter, APA family